MTIDRLVVALRDDRVAAVRCRDSGRWRDEAPGRASAADTVAALAARFPAADVAWLDEEIAGELSDPTGWAELHGPQELIHLGSADAEDRPIPSFGYVDFDSPYLASAARQRSVTSWTVSPRAGSVTASVLGELGFEPRLGWAPALIDVAHRGMARGLRPRTEPRLLLDPAGSRVEAHSPLDRVAVARLIRRIRAPRWLAFWGLCLMVHERRLPLIAALRGRRAPPARSAPGALSWSASRTPMERDRGNDAVTAIVPTLGRPRELEDLLGDLAAQRSPPVRVVVVEQAVEAGESDLTAVVERDWPFALEVATVPWIGVCRARNLALRAAATRWVMLLDDDLRVGPGLLGGLTRTADRHGVDAVVARIHRPDQEPPPPSTPRPWPVLASGATLVSRRAIAAVGGFDERLEGGFGEDWEMGARLIRAGHELLLDGEQSVLHLKAERGGFRHPLSPPWGDADPPPRPSPTVLASRSLHLRREQLRGYRWFYSLKRLARAAPLRWPREIVTLQRQWRVASTWRDRLLAAPAPGALAELSASDESASRA